MQNRIFGQPFSLAAGEITNSAQDQGGDCRLSPSEHVLAKALSAPVSQGLDQGKERKHHT